MAAARASRRSPMVIYENRWQARKVRWLSVGIALWAAGCIWWAADLARMDVPPEASAGEGWWAVVLVAVGLLSLAGMVVYRRVYVVRIVWGDAKVLVTTIGAVREAVHEHDLADFVASDRRGDGIHGGVHAPRVTLRVANRRLPYVIDVQAERFDRARIDALVRARPRR